MTTHIINDAGLALIKYYEGFSASVYICPGGHETIGYGHRILAGEYFGRDISEEEAGELLRNDVRLAEESIRQAVEAPINSNQFSALVSFVYNVGRYAFLSSTLLKKINANEHGAVPDEFKRWVWSNGKRLSGLVKRRDAEAELYLGRSVMA